MRAALIHALARRLGAIQRLGITPWQRALYPLADSPLQWAHYRLEHGRLRWTLAFADDMPGRALPRWLSLDPDGTSWPVHAIRAPRAHTQLRLNNSSQGGGQGMLAAVLQNSGGNGTWYALTAAHVLAGTAHAQVDDRVEIQYDNGQTCIGALENWAPVIGSHLTLTEIDAAIARLPTADAQRLMAANPRLAPAATGALDAIDTPLLIEGQNGSVPALFRGYFAGWVDAETTASPQDYYLSQGITYQASPATQPGDSGAALLDAAGNALLGLHSAGVADSGEDWNGVGCAIAPVLTTLGLQLATSAPIALPPPEEKRVRAALPRQAPSLTGANADAQDVLARTVWGEARGGNGAEAGMTAVAHVVLNRVAARSWWGRTVVEVCRKPWQFSCWNLNDPNLPKMRAVTSSDAQFALALQIAGRAVAGTLGDDITHGATHYYATSMHTPPQWAVGRQPCAQVGAHLFFKDVG
ncbi:cell wall hydrolase [Amantichitinum ursilacus]|uniref:Cell Wall Hydrolase n=1 Tax=Amantichitinum ursilacus TaxID=857265 RepID=A0A0N0GNA4_9NEIS|nr:cell wall hydrolase [Amantichitinum ursilacus]KPC52602.1 Cell Wall Hydrolase [Amantichitinum ursilacus]